MEDNIGFILGVGLIFVLGVGIIGVFSSSKEEFDMLQREKCVLIKSIDTGKKIYCGKACFKPEIERTYQCKTRVLILNNH